MIIDPTSNITHDITHEHCLTAGCNNATEDVISLNNDMYNTICVSKKNMPFSNTEEILRDHTDYSQLPESSPETSVQGNGNEDKNIEFGKPSKIAILQNIIIQNNDNEPHYKAVEVDVNNLHYKEDCSEFEDPSFLPEESSDTSELEEEDKEEAVKIRETKGKKRKRNSGNWKKTIRKQKRAAGEEYLSTTNKLIGKHEMKAPCRDECRKQCNKNISVENRALIHSQFWNGSINLDQKRQFIASCIEEIPVERVRARTGARAGQRKASLKYFFSVDGKKFNVCRTYFLNTLNLSQTSVRNALSKRQLGGVVIPDQRGKHEPSNKISTHVRNNIREHITSFRV